MIFHAVYIIAKDSVLCLFAQQVKGEKQHKQFLCMYTVLRLLSQDSVIKWNFVFKAT